MNNNNNNNHTYKAYRDYLSGQKIKEEERKVIEYPFTNGRDVEREEVGGTEHEI